MHELSLYAWNPLGKDGEVVVRHALSREKLSRLTPEGHKQLLEWVHADSTEGLKAKAATEEAVMRNSPPDSPTFQDAVAGLAILNAEFAKREALAAQQMRPVVGQAGRERVP